MGNREREERERRIVHLQSRSSVFKAIAEGLKQGKKPDLTTAEEFYRQNATHLVPDHDYQIAIRSALINSQPELSEKAFRENRALEIFQMDLTVAQNFAQGIRYGKEGGLTSLDDLIKEEQAKLSTLQETEPVIEFRKMEVAGLF